MEGNWMPRSSQIKRQSFGRLAYFNEGSNVREVIRYAAKISRASVKARIEWWSLVRAVKLKAV